MFNSSSVFAVVALYTLCTASAQDPIVPQRDGVNTTGVDTTAANVSETTTAAPPVNPCAKCEDLASQAKSDFTNNIFFRKYQNAGLLNPGEQAGKRYCEEFRWAYQCFEHCTEELNGALYTLPRAFDETKSIIDSYCEPQWTTGGPGCRLADAKFCDAEYQRNMCGDEFTNWKTCVEDALDASGQDCSGLCTPARRFHIARVYSTELECALRKAVDGRCRDYVNYYCFEELKSSDTRWGVFENIHDDAALKFFDEMCLALDWPIECMNETVRMTVNYFGMDVNKPCITAQEEVIGLMQRWREIITPLCAGTPQEESLMEMSELCGDPPTTQRIATTTPMLPTTETPLSRVKVIKRRNNSNILQAELGFLSSLLLISRWMTTTLTIG